MLDTIPTRLTTYSTQNLHEKITANHLVFIDPKVDNYQTLVAGILPNTSVVVLDNDRDGIEQISQVLALHQEVNSLHIVSHGAPGQLYLGNSQLSYETLNRYAWQLMDWANVLSADAQLLLYGCEVGQTEQGKAFLQSLSELTGAVVAASDDLTGSTALGGDWELEVSTGAIVPALAFQPEVMAAYTSVLGAVVLDTSFNATGKVITDFGSNDFGYGISVQPDGKILVAGGSDNGTNQDFAIVRYNSDGTLDTSFNTTGKVTTDFGDDNDFGYSITVQSDGKILVAGGSYNGTNQDFAIVRYNSDGTLDTSFNTTGKVTTDFDGDNDFSYSISVQPDGRILVAGGSYNGTNQDFAIVRYNSDGTLDTSFNTTGKITTDFGGDNDSGSSITVQPDGKILVAGESYNGTNYDFAIARYNSDGTLDTSFNTTGKITTDFGSNNDYGYSITVQPDGKILVAGDSYNGTNYDFAIVRYNSDGTLDTSFNTTGKVTTDFGNDDSGYSITVQPDGKILVVGDSDNGTNYDFAIARYNSDGTPDTSFNTTGKVITDFGNDDSGYSITVQPDGKILVAGGSYNGTNSDFAIARYLVNKVPVVANEITNPLAIAQDSLFNFTVPANSFSDPDVGDTLTYFATLENGNALPSWLTFNTDSISFSGTAANENVGSLNIKVTAKDVAEDEASDVFTLTVNNVNDAPVLVKEITDQEVIFGNLFNFVVPINTFSDVDAEDILTYTATLGNSGSDDDDDDNNNDDKSLPSWLTFDTSTHTFSGTPSDDDVGNLKIKVTAKDVAGSEVSDVFTLTVNNVNDAPVLVKEITDQEVIFGNLFNFVVPINTFSDVDAGDILTYTATLGNSGSDDDDDDNNNDDKSLPSWLTFDTSTRTFSGTPSDDDVGNLKIKVTAKDVAGSEVSDVFTLAITEKTALNIQSITLLTKTTGDIFSVKTKLNVKGDKTKLSIKIKTSTSKEVNELGVFFVDDEQGTINGIAPGAEGYTRVALERSKVIFSSIANLPNGFNVADLKNILEFDSDTKLRFYMVSNSTTQSVLSGKTSFSSVLFSSATNSSTEEEGFSLNFQNLVVNVQATEQQVTLGTGLQGKYQGELIDLRSMTQSVTAECAVNREASYNNFIGFYQIADENGGIDTNGDRTADILVGQAGYAEAAVRGRVTGIDLTVDNQGTAKYTGSFGPNSLFAPFIIVDGRPDAILNSNNNKNVYFAFLGANSDKADHIRLLGNNTFGFEDLLNGGDKDYNDVIVQINLSVKAA